MAWELEFRIRVSDSDLRLYICRVGYLGFGTQARITRHSDYLEDVPLYEGVITCPIATPQYIKEEHANKTLSPKTRKPETLTPKSPKLYNPKTLILNP